MGTLWAWLCWWAFQDYFTVSEQAGIILMSSLIGIWACKVTAHNLGISDPGAIVWDEVVAFWLVLMLLSPADFKTQLMAFALFRFFDAAKPGPVAWADQLFKGFGWRGAFGIFLDDFVAAFCTLLCFAIWRAW
jgi:phosphatidylglycerophosphatase A